MDLYTAPYDYSGKDRLDITVKGKDPIGKVFAPTWKMVMGSKKGVIAWETYVEQYRDLMRQSYVQHRASWEELLLRKEVTLVCFCKDFKRCHRYLLAGYLSKLGAIYQGERGYKPSQKNLLAQYLCWI